MPVPARRVTVAVAMIVAVLLGVAHGATAVGPAGGLCAMNTARGAVPASFALEACVDGAAIVLRNQLKIPVRISVTGNSAAIATVTADMSVAAQITRLAYPGPAVMMPGDVVRVPIGRGEASVSVVDADAGGFYALAVTLSAFLPAGAVLKLYEAVAQGITEMVGANVRYRNCLAGANWIQQVACDVERQAAVTLAFAKMVVMGVAKGALAVVLDVANWFDFIGRQVPDVRTIAFSQRTLRQSAVTASGGLACPGGRTFFDVYNRANGPQNTMDYYNVVRGPKCVPGWAASYGTTGISGSGHEMTRCAWTVLRERNGAWTFYDFTFQFIQPCDPSNPDTSTFRDGRYKMCGPEVPAAIRSFIGC